MDVFTLGDEWREGKDTWVSIFVSPHHLWSETNGELLAKGFGEDLLEVDDKSLDFTNPEVFSMSMTKKGFIKSWESASASDVQNTFLL